MKEDGVEERMFEKREIKRKRIEKIRVENGVEEIFKKEVIVIVEMNIGKGRGKELRLNLGVLKCSNRGINGRRKGKKRRDFFENLKKKRKEVLSEDNEM